MRVSIFLNLEVASINKQNILTHNNLIGRIIKKERSATKKYVNSRGSN